MDAHLLILKPVCNLPLLYVNITHQHHSSGTDMGGGRSVLRSDNKRTCFLCCPYFFVTLLTHLLQGSQLPASAFTCAEAQEVGNSSV